MRQATKAALCEAIAAQCAVIELVRKCGARFEGNEFCFDGLRYSIRDDNWSDLIRFIGPEKVRAAISRATEEQGMSEPTQKSLEEAFRIVYEYEPPLNYKPDTIYPLERLVVRVALALDAARQEGKQSVQQPSYWADKLDRND